MWLGQVPWAGRYWALPFLTVLAPSARYYRQRGRRHKKLTDWARQMVLQLRRWLPQRSLVLVGDGGYAVLDLLHCCQSLAQPVTLIARLRLDAALYEPAPPRQPGRNGRPPLKGRRLPALKALLDLPTVSWVEVSAAWYDGTTRTVELTSQTAVWYRSGKPPVPIRWVLVRDPQGEFATQALLCTDLAVEPVQILEWFVLRWQLEVTFQEVRAHLGVETQRQWSDRAIAAVFAGASWHRCRTHFMANLLTRVPKRAQPGVATQDLLAWCAPSTSNCLPPRSTANWIEWWNNSGSPFPRWPSCWRTPRRTFWPSRPSQWPTGRSCGPTTRRNG